MAKIKVYSTPACPYCEMTKDFLRSRGVEFEDIDVSKDPEKAREMISKTGFTGVPQIEINGKMIIGFDVEAIEDEIKNIRR